MNTLGTKQGVAGENAEAKEQKQIQRWVQEALGSSQPSVATSHTHIGVIWRNLTVASRERRSMFKPKKASKIILNDFNVRRPLVSLARSPC
jgi:hypothetical protein